MTQRVLLLVLLPCLAGCPVYNRYEVRRTARVPHLVAPVGDGRPVAGRADVAATLSTVTDRGESGPNDTAGLSIVRTMLGLGSRIHLIPNLDAGPIFQFDMGGDALSPRTGSPETPDAFVLGLGLSARYSLPVGRFNLGLGAELLAYSLPYREERRCLDCNETPDTEVTVEQSRHFVPVVGLSLTPSFRLTDFFVVYGSLSARNHPTTTASEVVLSDPGDTGGDADDGDEAGVGPLNVVGQLGVSVQFAQGWAAFAHLAHSFNGAPVAYGPVFGAGVQAAFGAPPTRRRRVAPALPLEPSPDGGPPIVAPGPR